MKMTYYCQSSDDLPGDRTIVVDDLCDEVGSEANDDREAYHLKGTEAQKKLCQYSRTICGDLHRVVVFAL